MPERQILTAFYLADPAFSKWTARDAVRWSATRPETFPEPLDGKPVEYRFQRLKRSVIYDYVQTASSNEERFERAFAAGIVEIRGGRFEKPWRPSNRGEQGYVACDPEELEESGVSLSETWDVGQWIYTRSILGKDSEPRLAALPSSLLAWDALGLRSAE